MVHLEGLETAPSRFQRYDRRLQAVLVAWSISVGILVLGVRLLTANASLLSVGP